MCGYRREIPEPACNDESNPGRKHSIEATGAKKRAILDETHSQHKQQQSLDTSEGKNGRKFDPEKITM